MSFPMLLSHHTIRPIFGIALLNIGLFENTIEILMDRIKKEVQEFLRIMLIVTSKHGVLLTKDPLKMTGSIHIA
jgi:hypothetical protein